MRRSNSKACKSARQTTPLGALSKSDSANSYPELKQADEVQELLLKQIEEGANLCRQVEAQLRTHPAPGLETIIRLHRALVLKLSGELQTNPRILALTTTLMKSAMDWERLEEKRKDREFEQQKYRDQQAAKEAARLKEQTGRDDALQPETLEKIERELKLF